MTYTIRIDGSDVSFDSAPDETILDAAARHGIELPYSCRKGVCGNCRGQVLRGQVSSSGSAGHEAAAMAPDEHLFCHARAESDLCIRPRSWQRLDPDSRKTLEAKVFRITQPASDVTALQLRFASGTRAKFQAGQYLQVILADGQRRSFSMANAPHENDGVLLHIRHLPGGHFSEKVLPALAQGDVLKVELPFGDFRLREDSDRPMLLVAGGTGFAPIKSIIDHMVRRKSTRPLALYWGARQPQGLYALEWIAKWQRALPQLRFEPVISEAADCGWSGRTGLVHEAVLADHGSLAGHEVYACGAPAMVNALRQACVMERQLPPEHFFSDAFVSQGG